MNEFGTFYGIGVGPGDPELLTLKAIRIINSVDVVFAASSIKNTHSLAVEIARPHMAEGVDIRMLSFQMSNNEAEKHLLWKENVDRIAAELSLGKNCVFLTLGDSQTYSTFGYLAKLMKEYHPGICVKSVPGITSYLAAASSLNQPLVEGDESLLITSGARGGGELRKYTEAVENVVLLKTYRHVKDINDALDEADLLETSVAVTRCSREDEEVICDVRGFENRKPDYWSLIMAKRKKA